jgi:hypothetical protein
MSLENLIWPLKSLDEVFSLSYLSAKCDANIEISTITKIFNDIFGTEFTACDVENCLNKITNFNYGSFLKKVSIMDDKLKNRPVPCGSNYNNCKFCQSRLLVKVASPCVVFCLEEMKNGINVEKECSKCKVNYFIDKYKMNGCYNSDRYCIYISISRDSVFEVCFIA